LTTLSSFLALYNLPHCIHTYIIVHIIRMSVYCFVHIRSIAFVLFVLYSSIL